MEDLDFKYTEAYKRLGAVLIKNGQFFLKRAFDVKVKRTLNQTQIKNFFKELGYDKLYFADNQYSVIDWKVMQSIIKYSWVDRKAYRQNFWDCDDYALAFKAHVSETYLINSVALAKHIKVTIGDREVWHRACVVLAVDDYTLKAYLLETQNDKFVEIKKGVPLVIGSWSYLLSKIEF